MIIKVFIENERGSFLKNHHDEKTLTFLKSTVVSRTYPFPYGFVLNTLAADGDNVDVFILTNQQVKQGQILDCRVVGLMQQYEYPWDTKDAANAKLEADHNVLAVPIGDKFDGLDQSLKHKLTDFVSHVFDHIRIDKVRCGDFLDKHAAIQYIEALSV